MQHIVLARLLGWRHCLEQQRGRLLDRLDPLVHVVGLQNICAILIGDHLEGVLFARNLRRTHRRVQQIDDALRLEILPAAVIVHHAALDDKPALLPVLESAAALLVDVSFLAVLALEIRIHHFAAALDDAAQLFIGEIALALNHLAVHTHEHVEPIHERRALIEELDALLEKLKIRSQIGGHILQKVRAAVRLRLVQARNVCECGIDELQLAVLDLAVELGELGFVDLFRLIGLGERGNRILHVFACGLKALLELAQIALVLLHKLLEWNAEGVLETHVEQGADVLGLLEHMRHRVCLALVLSALMDVLDDLACKHCCQLCLTRCASHNLSAQL
eukprot:comp21215_c0_seq1/m.45200 comp21215_c0_seq1/g.45200  ORF comp21215_c0_seq1/g.45200 comp21215_c0_seq1/m.45200 type:complete len:334 (-) comp21215_c0_seq1:214-1215(-)